MDCKIFYSWQSDLENNTNRGFIEDALKKAVKSIRNDDSIKVEPVIDRDTQNVSGSPDIVNTIFEKIDEAQIFVCDVSIINSNLLNSTDLRFIQKALKNFLNFLYKDANYRLTPNPNVLIELGYAMKTLGEGKIIMVMNTAFGTPEQLPFDLRMRRILTYNMPENNQEKAPERNKLAKSFERAIRPILQALEEEIKRKIFIAEQLTLEIKKREILESRSKMKRYIKQLDSQIKDMTPIFSEKSVENENLLIKAINLTEELIIEFAGVTELIATTQESISAAISLYQNFGEIITHYSPPVSLFFKNLGKNRHQDSEVVSKEKSFDLDLYKFISHELFVTYFSFLIRENRWELILEIMKKKVFYPDEPWDFVKSLSIPLNDISQPVELFKNSSNHRHSEILNQRHTNGKIAEIVPMKQFIEADFFLFILSETQAKDNSDSYWHGWSLLYMKQTPKYLLEAKKLDFAEQLLPPLGLETIEELRDLISHAKTRLEQIWNNPSLPSPYLPLKDFNPEDIGSI
ncbi:MAG: hypothetical protein F6K40_27785 [Okeania sp. SIO3I5]|uniref:hypothetical protein n=1 Tax=Okeania sp. SIO3I5 TaxID=2607805 RepID=UPI0013B7EEE6|nr:hypothetical protein [Okeania sp. SIO3I5]NEQ39844.1 hypothetical protein [Okeania sp. SIO3I5]